MQKVKIEINASPAECERIYRALGVEKGRDIPRTTISMQKNRNKVIISIVASDLHALRAAMNSYMRWIDLSIQIEEVINNGS